MSESNDSNSSESDIKMPGYTESVLPIGLGKMGAEAGATVGAVAGPVGVVAGAAVGTVAGVAVGMAANEVLGAKDR